MNEITNPLPKHFIFTAIPEKMDYYYLHYFFPFSFPFFLFFIEPLQNTFKKYNIIYHLYTFFKQTGNTNDFF